MPELDRIQVPRKAPAVERCRENLGNDRTRGGRAFDAPHHDSAIFPFHGCNLDLEPCSSPGAEEKNDRKELRARVAATVRRRRPNGCLMLRNV